MMIPTFLSGLVRTIIIMTLSGGFLALLLLMTKPIVRHRLPKSAQYIFWLMALATFLIPISRIVALPGTIADIAPIHHVVERNVISTTEARERLSEIPISNVPEIIDAPVASNREVPPIEEPGFVTLAFTIFMVIYPMIVSLVLLCNFIGYALFIKKIRREFITPHPAVSNILAALTNGKRTPRIMISNYAATPMLIGVFKPMIILPNHKYTAKQIQSILLHELTHLRRFDVAIKWLSLLSCALHWFNPVMWFTKREIDRVCELSCDEAVIRNMDKFEKKQYGETLISVACTKKLPLPVLSTTMCEEKQALKERLIAIMKSKRHTKLTILISAVILMTVVLTACAVGAGGGNQNPAGNTVDSEANTMSDAKTDINAAPEAMEPQTLQQTAGTPITDSTTERPAYITIGGQQFSTDSTELILNYPELVSYEEMHSLTNDDLILLGYMTNLTSLHIDWNMSQVTDLSPLAGLSKLTTLSLIWNTQNPLEEPTNMQVTDISPLAGLTNLTTLTFVWDNQIADLSPLAGLTNLQHLNMAAQLTDLTALAKLENLLYLYLDCNQITDLTPLAGLKKLEVLQLGVNKITDLSPLAELTNLGALSLQRNQIADLSPLAGLSNLWTLDLLENNITDITPLTMLTNLVDLQLSYNQVSDLRPLAGLSNLYYLGIMENPVTDFSAVAHVDSIVTE